MESTSTKRAWVFVLQLSLALGVGLVGTSARAQPGCPIDSEDFEPDPEFTSNFATHTCDWRAGGSNQFMIIEPGYQIVLESDEERQVITALNQTKTVMGITTRVVEELESELIDGKWVKVERSLNYFARCKQTNSIFYFGEDVQIFDEDGNVISSEGAWLAGRNGAKPGIIMPGQVLVGGGYYEEIAPEDEALDKGRILSLERGCEVGDRTLNRLCVTIEGSTDCDDGTDEKVWAAGIGTVVDEDLELVSHGFVD